MTIQENIELKNFTTFKIGGPARFFARVKNLEELTEALAFAREKKNPFFILGGGSNILISDEGFAGLVIKIEIGGIEYKNLENGMTEVVAGAGVVWDTLVAETVDRGLFGLENLSLVYGTVGAAPVQNIGAYGVEAKDHLAWIEAVNTQTGEKRVFINDECQFGYRMSFFKTPEGKKYIITKVAFNLSKTGVLDTDYKDIAELISSRNIKNVSQKQLRDIIIEIRTNKLPNVKEYGTAGSFFKNPIISEAEAAEIKKQFPDILAYPGSIGKVKVSAAWVLDHLCGFKGYRDGDVGVYKNQALVLVNFGMATASQVQTVAQKMTDCVKQKTGIALEREVEYVGV